MFDMAVDPSSSSLNGSRNIITPTLISYEETLLLPGRCRPIASPGQNKGR
jgi:hypothetical protein